MNRDTDVLKPLGTLIDEGIVLICSNVDDQGNMVRIVIVQDPKCSKNYHFQERVFTENVGKTAKEIHEWAKQTYGKNYFPRDWFEALIPELFEEPNPSISHKAASPAYQHKVSWVNKPDHWVNKSDHNVLAENVSAEPEPEEESEGDKLMRFFKTPAGQWEGA